MTIFFNARLIKWSLNKDYPGSYGNPDYFVRIRGHHFLFYFATIQAKLFHYQLMSHLVFYFENRVYILILLSFVQHCMKQRCSNVT